MLINLAWPYVATIILLLIVVIIQMIDCQELNCAFGEVTPPGSCCPVCGEYLLLHNDHPEVTNDLTPNRRTRKTGRAKTRRRKSRKIRTFIRSNQTNKTTNNGNTTITYVFPECRVALMPSLFDLSIIVFVYLLGYPVSHNFS